MKKKIIFGVVAFFIATMAAFNVNLSKTSKSGESLSLSGLQKAKASYELEGTSVYAGKCPGLTYKYRVVCQTGQMGACTPYNCE